MKMTTPIGFLAMVALVPLVSLANACSSSSSANDESARGVEQADNSGHLNRMQFANPSGSSATYSDNPKIMLKKNKVKDYPFFTSFGTNGRACVHCHVPGDGWGISAASVQRRFSHPFDTTNADCLLDAMQCPPVADAANEGLDPIFRLVDGANAPTLDVSTAAARQRAFSMLLAKGLIRVGIGVPANAEFELAAVDDPYGYASARELSLFRRPLPSTNLRLSPGGTRHDASLSAPVINSVMWDGRETLPDHDIIEDLLDQANGATLGHAQATAGLSAADRQSIVDFETGLHTAQFTDVAAGDLGAAGGNGGPEWLAANQPVYVGINDVIAGDSMTHLAFTPDVFTIFAAWGTGASTTTAAQARVARGEALFNRKRIAIGGVRGLNDVLGVASLDGTCTTCHDSPNYGHHSVRLPIDIGLTDASRRTPDLPLYTLRNKTTGAVVQTTDPGRALVTGKWADIGKFKGPILRGLAARAPYFHNGSAATLADAVSFYDARFAIGFTPQEKADLVAFLQTL